YELQYSKQKPVEVGAAGDGHPMRDDEWDAAGLSDDTAAPDVDGGGAASSGSRHEPARSRGTE
ncbi:MAG TPA: hypothetical protein VJX91_03560, partial [Candidatus Eisenbacteria bacterium]|nr:hypothetical protein [Candidatus Eisenbacteria bacterium]